MVDLLSALSFKIPCVRSGVLCTISTCPAGGACSKDFESNVGPEDSIRGCSTFVVKAEFGGMGAKTAP
eukprot:scaffold2952_cov40-Tisochrysis_lutea.AAC.2